MIPTVDPKQMALVKGWDYTLQTLHRWRSRPLQTVVPWFALSLSIAVALLFATWLLTFLMKFQGDYVIPGVTQRSTFGTFADILWRNGLVLLLHTLACFAGFIAGFALPELAEGHSGLMRKIHDRAGRIAIAIIAVITLFSFSTQAYILSGVAKSDAVELGISPLLVLVGVLPHALVELSAVFLPLAAWTLASRRNRWNELLAATMVTFVIAVPLVIVAGAIECWVSPHLIRAIAHH